MIRLNCFIKVSEEHRDEVLAAARRLTEASLRQEGCIAYDIFESATRPDVLMFCETWRDQEALDAHATSAEFVKETKTIHDLADLKLERLSFDR
ncbi:MAG: antibiotic biosynthesis monooxygenase [Muribaculaceae bacterium]|nr:antibiotic biosynthesis monooxygenase [Muribaculaceae bacterium]